MVYNLGNFMKPRIAADRNTLLERTQGTIDNQVFELKRQIAARRMSSIVSYGRARGASKKDPIRPDPRTFIQRQLESRGFVRLRGRGAKRPSGVARIRAIRGHLSRTNADCYCGALNWNMLKRSSMAGMLEGT
jgi:hypothetical protein